VTVTPQGRAHPWAAERDIGRDDLLLLDCLTQGLDDAAIGRRLFTTVNGVKSRVARLKPKMGASNRSHLVALAMTMGLIRLDSPSGAPLDSTT
jgi:DNA-binding NarL/FixJ family response regulator